MAVLTSKTKQADAQRKAAGTGGEDHACRMMEQAGFTILARNYAEHGIGEIDIIGQKDDLIVFCEVKTRGINTIDRPAAAVNLSKQKKICKTALLYLQKYAPNLQPRFDVIEVFGAQTADGFLIRRANWIEQAFEPSADLRFF